MCSVLHDLSLMCRVFSEEILFRVIIYYHVTGLVSNDNGDSVVLHSKMSRCNFAIFQSNLASRIIKNRHVRKDSNYTKRERKPKTQFHVK